jgi:hypothetical protein
MSAASTLFTYAERNPIAPLLLAIALRVLAGSDPLAIPFFMTKGNPAWHCAEAQLSCVAPKGVKKSALPRTASAACAVPNNASHVKATPAVHERIDIFISDPP